MEECVAYFRQALTDPQSVPPWSEWWASHADTVEQLFPLVEFVRLKHRRLRGARQMFQIAGFLPKDFTPPSPLVTGSCTECGERTTNHANETGGVITCPVCGPVLTYDSQPETI